MTFICILIHMYLCPHFFYINANWHQRNTHRN